MATTGKIFRITLFKRASACDGGSRSSCYVKKKKNVIFGSTSTLRLANVRMFLILN